jgi:hypothetical protein
MNDDAKRITLQDAYATLERTRDLKQPRAAPVEQNEDALTKWRRDMETQEKEFAIARAKRKAARDAARDNAEAWQAWVGDQIRDAVKGVGRGLGEILSDKLVQIGEAFDKRDQRIDQLECQLYRAMADFEQLRARVIKNEIAHDHSDNNKLVDVPSQKLKMVN